MEVGGRKVKLSIWVRVDLVAGGFTITGLA